MELYLLRHAERGHGKKRDILTKTGTSQALNAAKVLGKIKFDKIICGTKKRAKDTLKPLLKYQRYSVCYTPLVNEQEMGDLEFVSKKTWKKEVEKSELPEKEFRPKNGENRRDAYFRAKKFYNVLAKQKLKKVLVVSHSGFISDLMGLLLKSPLKENFKIKVDFCEIIYLNLRRDVFKHILVKDIKRYKESKKR